MKNIESHYPVVGILEDMNSTLKILQTKVPKYFRDVTNLYTNKLKGKQFIEFYFDRNILYLLCSSDLITDTWLLIDFE